MKFAKKMSLLLTIAAAMTYSAAATDAQAKFTLAHDTQLGATILPAGDYRITMSSDGTTKAFITPVNHSGAAVIAVPMSTDDYATCKSSSLTMQVVGSKWSVSSICFAETQTALYFPVSNVKVSSTPGLR